MARAFTTVFSRPRHVLVALLVAGGLFLFVTWLPNRDLLKFALASDTISFWRLVWQSPQFFAANTTPATAWLTLGVLVLSGVNIAMLAYYLKRRIQTSRGTGAGLAGTVVGLLGVGCAACGSVILSSIFGLGAAAGFLGFLPFRGIELGVIGLGALLASIVLLARKIQNPAVCAIDTRHSGARVLPK